MDSASMVVELRLFHFDMCLWYNESTTWIGPCSRVHLHLLFVHFLYNWSELIAISRDCWLHLLELALTHRMLGRHRIVVLTIARNVHAVDILHDKLLFFCVMVLWTWDLSLLNVLDGGCLFALNIESWLTGWFSSTIELQVWCFGTGLGHLRLLRSTHCDRVLMLSNMTRVCASFHIHLFAWHLLWSIIRGKWSFLLLNSCELLLCSDFSLASLIWIISSHALLMNWISDCFWSWDSVSICVSTFLLLGAVLSQSRLFLGRVLIWILLVIHLGLNHLLLALRCVLLLLTTNWWIYFVVYATSIRSLIFRHDVVESLVFKISIALLFLWLVYWIHRWTSSCVGSL